MRLVATLLLFLLVVGCPREAPSLVGEWSNEHPQGGLNTLQFKKDGIAIWHFQNPEVGSFSLTYAIDYSANPHYFSLSGFDRGPLKGLTLYGILEFKGPDLFRLDVEPGPVGSDGSEVRPTEFTDDTQEYRRIR